MDTYKEKFLVEALEHIDDLEQALLELENDQEDKELIERVFRAMHSLKGGGAMFGFENISNFTHHLESIYDLIRNDELNLSKDILDITLESVDHLKELLVVDENVPINEDLSGRIIKVINNVVTADEEENNFPTSESSNNKNKGDNTQISTYYILFQPKEDIFNNGTNPLYLLDELASLGKSKCIPHINNIPELKSFDPLKCYTYWEMILATKEEINSINDVFIFVEDDCVLEVNQLSKINLLENSEFVNKVDEISQGGNATIINDLQQYLNSNQSESKTSSGGKKKTSKKKNGHENSISSIRVSSDKLDLMMNLVSELVTTQARLSLYSEQDTSNELIAISEDIQKLTRQLRDNAFSIVLIPIENMITRFQRLIRDLSKDLNKEVVFEAEGTETELDKTIIESLTDPIMHILRNSLDHGIESAEKRKLAGKPKQGKILIKAFYSGGNVIIQISDDGAGINKESVKRKAINKGLISSDAILSDKEIADLIFQPGFSTAVNVTDVSGRGVGMDVVRRKITDIRGEVEVNSVENEGTTITIKLPLTLSIIDGLLVDINKDFYIIPLSAVDKIHAITHDQIADNFNRIIVLDEKQVPYFYLREEFEMNENNETKEQIVIIKYEEKQIGLVVDNVIGEYQAVLKPLGRHYKNQEIISGATILGDGTVALVLDTNKVVKHFSEINLKEE